MSRPLIMFPVLEIKLFSCDQGKICTKFCLKWKGRGKRPRYKSKFHHKRIKVKNCNLVFFYRNQIGFGSKCFGILVVELQGGEFPLMRRTSFVAGFPNILYCDAIRFCQKRLIQLPFNWGDDYPDKVFLDFYLIYPINYAIVSN